MKQRIVQTVTDNGITYGQGSNKLDLELAQDFFHERVNELSRDFINNTGKEIFGFNYTLTGNFQITVGASGRVYNETGKQFHLAVGDPLNVAPADPTYGRLDLIVAVLDEDVETAMQLIPFVRLRTSGEIAAGTHYAPQNFNAPTEKQCRAVVQIKTGTPGASPVAPTADSNEIPLYLIAVAPGALRVQASDITDLRRSPLTLRAINDLIRLHDGDIARLKTFVENFTFGDFGPAFAGLSLKDILNAFKLQLDSLREFPEIRYERPRAPLTDPATSKIIAAGTLDNGVPTVEIEIGAAINFGYTNVIVRPEKFADQTLNPRFKQVAGSSANDLLVTPLTLSNITQVAGDADVEFNSRVSKFASGRSRAACAARNSQYVEIFGGVAANNDTPIGEWLTYDVANDTLTPRTPSIPLPNSGRPCLIPYGDGIHVLFISSSGTSNETRHFYKVNCATNVVTELTTGDLPYGMQFFGDLIAPGKIFIVGVNDIPLYASVDTRFYELDTATGVFTALGTTGTIPDCNVDFADGCFYQENEFVLVSFLPHARTFVFNRTNLQWRELTIQGPARQYSGSAGSIFNFKMANVGGKPTFVGGLLSAENGTNQSRLWQLNTAANYANYSLFNAGNASNNAVQTYVSWTARASDIEMLQKVGFCSLLGNDNRATGAAVIVGGQDVVGEAKRNIYSSVRGGLIVTTYNGQPAITLSPTANFAQFLVPFYQADWDVAGYLMSLAGTFNDSNLLAEVSFDNGAHFHRVRPDSFLAITDSLNPGKRILRITLYNLQSSRPIVANLTEVFNQDGADLEERIVIAYNAPNTTKALYIDRDGKITLSATVEPSSPTKCLLHKVTPNGSSAPTLKNFINRRRPHIRYSKVKSGAADSTQFDNDLAVPARFAAARAFKTDKTLYHVDEPVPTFDGTIEVVGVAANGDRWEVELEG